MLFRSKMENKKVSVELSVSDWNVVLNALAMRPYGEVKAVVENIMMQANEKNNSTE